MNDTFVYKSNGFYLGYIRNGYLISRDGVYLGWIEGNYAWDSRGLFRGMLSDINNHKYILFDRFALPPVPRTPKNMPALGPIPTPPSNIAPITLPVQMVDGFNL
jgi:hypothetical protein